MVKHTGKKTLVAVPKFMRSPPVDAQKKLIATNAYKFIEEQALHGTKLG